MKSRPPAYSGKEVAAMFGYATDRALWNAITDGRFPPPDVRLYGQTPGSKRRVYWNMATLDAERKRREAVNESGRRGGKLYIPKLKGDQA